ncbi:MAG: bifunctional metallophosphatase/5'-nucleotidase [Oscillatoria princeps RMCB-10]|jgi:5'-nucleotidase|nr:bifunctional metallophosphatase/5'-nucleotidase [Oscillatoria princeps RMCB-10]
MSTKSPRLPVACAGGLARLATLRKQLLQKNPRTYTILAGDFLSPSALGAAKVNGEPLAGQQIVAVLNAMGLDYATFGNHEFDLNEKQFKARLKECRFKMFSSNVFEAAGKPFDGIPPDEIITVKGNRGSQVRVGLIGVTIDSNPASYVSYRDPIETAREQVRALKGKADILVAVTHLNLAQDQKLAETVPEIDLILGGHEHENIQQWRGSDFTPLFKADANARTVYTHNLHYDLETRRLQVESRVQPLTDEIPEDAQTGKVVREWLERGFQAFRASGFEPEQVVGTASVALDGLEASVRNHPTLLTELIALGMLREVRDAELAIFNGGAIRIDDVIPPGDVTQYDVIRILPFGGKVLSVAIEGELLKRVLDRGMANRGTGGYLQTANVSKSRDGTGWLIAGQPLDESRRYRVAVSDFLVSGKEIGLDFLTLKQAGVQLLEEGRDIRFALIEQLKSQKGSLSSAL